jgi:hypothetical protein
LSGLYQAEFSVRFRLSLPLASAGLLFSLLFDLEGYMFQRNVKLPPNYTALELRRARSSAFVPAGGLAQQSFGSFVKYSKCCPE